MTSLNPSHNPFRSPSGRHAQAVHQQQPSSSAVPPDDSISDLDSDLDTSDASVDDHVRAKRRGKREARRKIRGAMPPMPDLRFEQSYLLSIRPFLTPRPTHAGVKEKGPVVTDDQPSKSLVTSTEEDAVFHWGRQVDVNWPMVVYVTLRDQFLSPLIQGALWGWGTLLLASTSLAIRQALYPPSHVPRGRMTGGPGGKISEAGGGSAVGGTWWRKFVKSWSGAVETAAV